MTMLLMRTTDGLQEKQRRNENETKRQNDYEEDIRLYHVGEGADGLRQRRGTAGV